MEETVGRGSGMVSVEILGLRGVIVAVQTLRAKDPIHSGSQARPGRWSSLPLDVERSRSRSMRH